MRGHFDYGIFELPTGMFGCGQGFRLFGCSDCGGPFGRPHHHGPPGCRRRSHHRGHDESPDFQGSPPPFHGHGPHHHRGRFGHHFDHSPDRHGPHHRSDESPERHGPRDGPDRRGQCGPHRHGRPGFGHHGHRRGPPSPDRFAGCCEERFPCFGPGRRPGPYARSERERCGCKCQKESCCSGNKDRSVVVNGGEEDHCESSDKEQSTGDTVLVQRIVVEKAARPRSV